jgi:hypothetical protein
VGEGNEVGIDVAANQGIFGQIPQRKQLLVSACVEIHRDELVASWNAGRLTGEYFKLDPPRQCWTDLAPDCRLKRHFLNWLTMNDGQQRQ